MGFNIGKIFRTIVNPIIGRPTPAAQSAAYQAQGMAAANQVADQINYTAATNNAANSAAAAQQTAVQQQQTTQNQLQADNLAASDESLRNAARMASKGSTANVLYGSNYNKKDEKTSSVLLGA